MPEVSWESWRRSTWACTRISRSRKLGFTRCRWDSVKMQVPETCFKNFMVEPGYDICQGQPWFLWFFIFQICILMNCCRRSRIGLRLWSRAWRRTSQSWSARSRNPSLHPQYWYWSKYIETDFLTIINISRVGMKLYLPKRRRWWT